MGPFGASGRAHAIVVLRHTEVDSQLRRGLLVVKIRGSDHSREVREFTIDDTGLCLVDRFPSGTVPAPA